MSANGTQTKPDPRVAELLRRRGETRDPKPAASPAPAPALSTPLRCPACAGSIDGTLICRRCHPEEYALARARARPDEPPPKRKAALEDVHLPEPPAPAPAPAPKLRREEPATNRCPSCSGRINSFSGKCPRCDAKPPTTYDVKPVEVRSEPAPVPAPPERAFAPEEQAPPPQEPPRPPVTRRQIGRQEVANIKALALEGTPAEHIARRLGLDRMSVHRRVKAMRDSGELPPLVNGRAVPAAMHRTPPMSRPSSDLTPPAPAQETSRETPREIPPAPDAPPAPGVKSTRQTQEPPPDPELAAIAAVSTLPPRARARVLGYLSARFGPTPE